MKRRFAKRVYQASPRTPDPGKPALGHGMVSSDSEDLVPPSESPWKRTARISQPAIPQRILAELFDGFSMRDVLFLGE